MTSSCCKAEITTNTGYDGDTCRDCRQNKQNCEGGHTMYYVCSKCRKPCDSMTQPTIKEKMEKLLNNPENIYYFAPNATQTINKEFLQDFARLICEEMTGNILPNDGTRENVGYNHRVIMEEQKAQEILKSLE